MDKINQEEKETLIRNVEIVSSQLTRDEMLGILVILAGAAERIQGEMLEGLLILAGVAERIENEKE